MGDNTVSNDTVHEMVPPLSPSTPSIPSILPTMRVNLLKEEGPEGGVLINRSDFNPELHEELDPSAATEDGAEGGGKKKKFSKK